MKEGLQQGLGAHEGPLEPILWPSCSGDRGMDGMIAHSQRLKNVKCYSSLLSVATINPFTNSSLEEERDSSSLQITNGPLLKLEQ